ncbi:MAG TPA: hypothetical protein PKY96_02215, partial [Flavobacteriales bacterium]|nr:hypothetical protein [Flavobacteriales bacterium]
MSTAVMLTSGAADGGHAAVVDARLLDEVEALVLHAAALVREHERERLGHIHHVAAADADEASGKPSAREDVVAKPIDLLRAGLLRRAAEDDFVAGLLGDARDEFSLPLEVVIHQEDEELLV